MFLKFYKNNRGFALIEALIYVAVLSVIILVISTFFLWVNKASIKATVMEETLNNANKAMEMIVYEIKTCQEIYQPTSVFSNDNGQLSLKTNEFKPDGESATIIDFFICNDSRICLKKESQNPIFLTSGSVNVEKLKFDLVFNDDLEPSVSIDLQVDYDNPLEKPEYQHSVNLKTTTTLRNY
ncbi:MAG: type II secretion system protein [bacterium]|nr:type II secretion system protein [bacterium]